MAHTCTKCSRVSPDDAEYCYWDGIALNSQGGKGGPVSIGTKPFSAPFTFASGQVCQNFDQLAIGCVQNWSAALDMLKQGYLEKFLAGQGLADLAMAAKQAAKFPDKDRGLDEFLDKLPTQAVQKPQLQVEPTDINLGTLKVGTDKKIELKLRNEGQRLLYGSVVAENCNWISIGSASGGQKKLFQFGSELSIALHVSGKRLRASSKPLEGRIVVSSNAGDVTINIRADVPVKAYPDGVLAGAKSPRQVAEKAKANPKDSAPLFEKGAVAQWYKDNGWIYPVRGPAASGMGAVQQFFEALGLTAPPKVSINQNSVTLQAEPGQRIEHLLEVRTEEKRPVFAHGVADQPWVEVGRAKLNGRTAQVPLVISSVPNRPGETITAKVAVTSNGNKKFLVPVTLKIGGSANIFAAAVGGGSPVAAGAGAFDVGGPMVVPSRRGSSGSNPMHFLPLLLLFLVLGGLVGWDLLAANVTKPTDPPIVTKKSTVPDSEFGYDESQLKDSIPRVAIRFNSGKDRDRFGILLTQQRDPNELVGGAAKRLFFEADGSGNNTMLRLNGSDYVFGDTRYKGIAAFAKDHKNTTLRQFPIATKKNRAFQSTMTYDDKNGGARLEMTQIVEIVPGETTKLLDTVLCKYTIKNVGTVRATVGLRVLLDTYIGGNDGVPFFVPPVEGTREHMVESKEVMTLKQIPDFVQVLEKGDLTDPSSTNAILGLRLNGFEDPSKFVICRYPNESGGGYAAGWGSEDQKPGDWQYTAMNEPIGKPKDSCVVIYWNESNMAPGETRVMGYTYGLGKIAGEGEPTIIAGDKNKQMGLQVVSAKVNRPFIATAYVKGEKDQKVTLKLPPGVTFASGETAEKSVDATKERAAISWSLIAPKEGTYKLEATAPNIGTATASVEIGSGGIFK